MNRSQEIVNLLELYIKIVQELKPEIPWGSDEELLQKFVQYRYKILKEGSPDETWFNSECINSKSIQGEIFEVLNSRNKELQNIGIRLRNLNTINTYDQISSSTTHFEPLAIDSKKYLLEKGFYLIEEGKSILKYVNKDLKLQIVYQSYDPPEIWISRINDEIFLRLDRTVENYFNKNENIWKKYSADNQKFFNYSKFAYYDELLSLILDKLMKMGDFVETINNWKKQEYSKRADL